MNKRKFQINLWPYVITATVIFVVFKMNGTIDWSWFKVLLPVIVYMVLAVVAALVLIALSLYKVKLDFKKTLEEQLAAAEQRSADLTKLAEIRAAERKKMAEEASFKIPEDMKNGKTMTPTSKAD